MRVIYVSPGKLRIYLNIDFNRCLILCGFDCTLVSESQRARAAPSLDWVAAAGPAPPLSLNCFLFLFYQVALLSGEVSSP